MGSIYTGIDLGSNCIKIVVANKMDDKFNVIAAVSSKSEGIRKGQITDTKKAVSSVKTALARVEEMLGVSLSKAILSVPTTNSAITIVSGRTEVIDNEEISGEDITNVFKDALLGKVDSNHEIITTIPINFTVNDETVIDPKGLSGDFLETKVVVVTVPKEPLYRMLEVVKLSGVEVVDVAFNVNGDYFQTKSSDTDKKIGAIINVGEELTTLAVFNKGIMIKTLEIPVGSRYVDKDLSFVYKIDETTAKSIKEDFAVAVSRYADSNDIYDLVLENGEKKELKQLEISKVVESRIYEILKLAKKELKTLTNREISYIIITGGLSELAGFQYAVEDILGRSAKKASITSMGVRHNKYSSVLGIIKYYDDKLNLRGKNTNMFNSSEIDLMMDGKKQEVVNDNMINRVFGHFFDN